MIKAVDEDKSCRSLLTSLETRRRRGGRRVVKCSIVSHTRKSQLEPEIPEYLWERKVEDNCV